MVLFDRFKGATLKYPDLPVFIDKKTGITYKELYQDVLQTAEYFKQQGIKKGDYVTVMISMSIDLYKTLISLWFLGAIPVFFDVSAKNDYIEKCSQIIRPRFIVGTSLTLLFARRIKAFNNVPVLNIKHDFIQDCPTEHETGIENEPALITFTSGSTGTPKTIVRTHQFLLDQYEIIKSSLHYKPLTVDLGFLPVFTLANIATGITTIIPNSSLKNMGQINAAKIVKQIVTCKVNSMTVSPAVLSQILDYADKHNIELNSLKTIHVGGGPVFPSMLPTTNKLPAKVYIVYGSSEAEPISMISWEEMLSFKNKIETGYGLPVGRIIDNVNLRIKNNDIPIFNENLVTNIEYNIGEIIVSGDNVLKGYYKGVGDAENKIYENETIWHRTGDCGYVDNNNILWLLGRKNNLIKYNNEIIFPFSIQTIFKEKYGVNNVCLLTIKDTTYMVFEKKDKMVIEKENIPLMIKYKDLETVFVNKFPMDKRHNAKIDINELKKMILK